MSEQLVWPSPGTKKISLCSINRAEIWKLNNLKLKTHSALFQSPWINWMYCGWPQVHLWQEDLWCLSQALLHSHSGWRVLVMMHDWEQSWQPFSFLEFSSLVRCSVPIGPSWQWSWSNCLQVLQSSPSFRFIEYGPNISEPVFPPFLCFPRNFTNFENLLLSFNRFSVPAPPSAWGPSLFLLSPYMLEASWIFIIIFFSFIQSTVPKIL